MGRFFLSGQTTCALLLGAGLLLRAQAALRGPETQGAPETPRTRPAEMMGERAPRIVRNTPSMGVAPPRTVHRPSHTRKGFAHRDGRHKVRKGGVALAGRGNRQG